MKLFKAGKWHKDLLLKLTRLLLTILIFWAVASSAILYFESKEEKSSIKEYHQALWYTLVTISTVGYGDHYPITSGGKIVGGVIIVYAFGIAGFIMTKIQEAVVNDADRKAKGLNGCHFTGHYVIVGWNPFSKVAVGELLHAGKKVAILAEEEKDINDIDSNFQAQKGSIFKTFGILENEEVYNRMALAHSNAALIICEDDAKTIITALQLKDKNHKLHVIAHIQNQTLKKTMRDAGVTFAVSSNEVVGRLLASFAYEPDVAHSMEDLLSAATESENDYDLQEYLVTHTSELSGKEYGQAYKKLRERNGGILVGIYSPGKIGMKDNYVLGPPDSTVLGVGDYIIVIVNKNQSVVVAQITGAAEQGRRQ